MFDGVLEIAYMRRDIVHHHLRPALLVRRVREYRQKDAFNQNSQLINRLRCHVAERQNAPKIVHRDRLLLLPNKVCKFLLDRAGELRHRHEQTGRRNRQNEQPQFRVIEEVHNDFLETGNGAL